MPRSKQTSKRVKKSRIMKTNKKSKKPSRTKYLYRKNAIRKRVSKQPSKRRAIENRVRYSRKYQVAFPNKNVFFGKTIVNTYKWSRNSCFFDSTLVLLLGTMMYSNFIFNKIFIEPPQSQFQVCHPIKSKDYQFKLDVQNQLIKEADYLFGHKRIQKQCTLIRRLFTNCKLGGISSIDTGEMEDTDFVLNVVDKIFNLSNIKIRYVYMNKGNVVNVEDRFNGFKISVTAIWEQKQTSTQSIVNEQVELKEFNTRNDDNLTYDSITTYIIDAQLLTISVTRIDTDSETGNGYNKSYVVFPDENITLNGNIKLKLSGILLWQDYHYTLLIRDANNKWWHYDDTDNTIQNRMEFVGSYHNMINFKKRNPSIWGRDYWYVKV